MVVVGCSGARIILATNWQLYEGGKRNVPRQCLAVSASSSSIWHLRNAAIDNACTPVSIVGWITGAYFDELVPWYQMKFCFSFCVVSKSKTGMSEISVFLIAELLNKKEWSPSLRRQTTRMQTVPPGKGRTTGAANDFIGSLVLDDESTVHSTKPAQRNLVLQLGCLLKVRMQVR